MSPPWDAIAWWEFRRIPYNAVLALIGALTIGEILWITGDLGNPLGVIIGIGAYGVVANLFYTLGWISELLWSGGDTSRTEPFRKRVFRIGLIASCAVTLMPAVAIAAIKLIFGYPA
jgi:hypothetical protein